MSGSAKGRACGRGCVAGVSPGGAVARGRRHVRVQPWEVATVMVFLAGDYASCLTGEVIPVSSQHP
jgi:hypothetical protein